MGNLPILDIIPYKTREGGNPMKNFHLETRLGFRLGSLLSVLVIALFALTIYRSYMETSDTSLKAKDDIIDVRNTILDNRTHV